MSLRGVDCDHARAAWVSIGWSVPVELDVEFANAHTDEFASHGVVDDRLSCNSLGLFLLQRIARCSCSFVSMPHCSKEMSNRPVSFVGCFMRLFLSLKGLTLVLGADEPCPYGHGHEEQDGEALCMWVQAPMVARLSHGVLGCSIVGLHIHEFACVRRRHGARFRAG